MTITNVHDRPAIPADRAGSTVVDEVDPLADIVAGTSTTVLGQHLPGDLWAPLWRLVVTSDYGIRTHPVLGTRRFHRGVDYGARAGTTVRAAAAGTIVWANELGPYGNLVVIAHGADLHTAYGHLESIAATVGEPVRIGQRIGRVGSTGLATGPHLHFEVRNSGTPTDPTPWIEHQSGPLTAVTDALTARARGALRGRLRSGRRCRLLGHEHLS